MKKIVIIMIPFFTLINNITAMNRNLSGIPSKTISSSGIMHRFNLPSGNYHKIPTIFPIQYYSAHKYSQFTGKNPYEILGVNPNASQAEIRKAYRIIAKQYHPDIAGKQSEEDFKLINDAYEKLTKYAKPEAEYKSSEKKRQYEDQEKNQNSSYQNKKQKSSYFYETFLSSLTPTFYILLQSKKTEEREKDFIKELRSALLKESIRQNQPISLEEAEIIAKEISDRLRPESSKDQKLNEKDLKKKILKEFKLMHKTNTEKAMKPIMDIINSPEKDNITPQINDLQKEYNKLVKETKEIFPADTSIYEMLKALPNYTKIIKSSDNFKTIAKRAKLLHANLLLTKIKAISEKINKLDLLSDETKYNSLNKFFEYRRELSKIKNDLINSYDEVKYELGHLQFYTNHDFMQALKWLENFK